MDKNDGSNFRILLLFTHVKGLKVKICVHAIEIEINERNFNSKNKEQNLLKQKEKTSQEFLPYLNMGLISN